MLATCTHPPAHPPAHSAARTRVDTLQAFACLVRLFEAREASAAGAGAPGAGQQPQLDSVQQRCWRMNIGRWVALPALPCPACVLAALHVCVGVWLGVAVQCSSSAGA